SVGCMASAGGQLPADGFGDMHPEVSGEPERRDVDALVVPVEARAEHLKRYLAAEQTRAVRDDALLPEEAGIRATYDQTRDELGARIGYLCRRRESVPEGIAARRCRRIGRCQRCHLHAVGEPASPLAAV